MVSSEAARVVAVVRDGRPVALDGMLRTGDVVVAVGAEDGLAALAARLEPAP